MHSHRVMRKLQILWLAALAACGTAEAAGGTVQVNQVNQSSTRLAGCVTTPASTWRGDFIPQQTGHFTLQVGLKRGDVSDQPIDAVVGLASGSPQRFADLGPTVRLNTEGQIDVRNGDTYAADAPFDYLLYAPSDPFVWVTLDVDVPNHRYSVKAFHDGHDDTVQIATDYAFRTEQSGVTRLDAVGQFVDQPVGQLVLCDPDIRPQTCVTSAAIQTWNATAFRPQTGKFQLEIDAEPINFHLDGVVGLAATTPAQFSDLAAIFRFNPDGFMDVRDGDAYRADRAIAYTLAGNYRVAFDVDVPAHRYSVAVRGPGTGANFVPLATDYAFRTEQAAASSLGVLGQYIDAPADADHALITCDLTAMY
jgi:hypothetical protein